jgi:hypothetical protein
MTRAPRPFRVPTLPARWAPLALAALALAASPAAPAQDAGTSLVDVSQLSSAREQLDFGRQAQTRVGAVHKAVAKLYEDAAKEGSQEKVACLEPHRSSVQAVKEVTDRDVQRLIRHLDGSAPVPDVGTLLRGIGILASRADQYLAQAESCVGAQGGSSNSTSSVDSNVQALADGDTDMLGPGDDVLDLEPPDTSPFE